MSEKPTEESVNGLLKSAFSKLPEVGDRCVIDGVTLVFRRMDGRSQIWTGVTPDEDLLR